MNIQFMTAEKNGIPTGEVDYLGRPRYRYVPDFSELIANATCEEEIQAIKDCEQSMEKGLLKGFVQSIVFTIYDRALVQDEKGLRFEKKWQIYQHAWYENNGIRYSQAKMRKEIEEMFKCF